MKVFVSFEPKYRSCDFEGTRLRKNLKGALELSGVGWVSSLFASPDIVHLVSPEDERLAIEAKRSSLPLVISAFYSENDPGARFLETESRDGEIIVKKQAMRFLALADLLLVPSEGLKTFLINSGIRSRIAVLSAGVNLTRFEKADKIEEIIFSRYVSLPAEAKYIFLSGDYDDNEQIEDLNTLAAMVPSYRFYFVGLSKKGMVSAAYRKRLAKNSSRNVYYLDLLEDDVYRSAINGCSAYVSLNTNRPDNLTALEAMASKKQVFAYKGFRYGDCCVNEKNSYVTDSLGDLAALIERHCLSSFTPTIIGGYKDAKASSLRSVGKRLKAYYESLLK